MGETPEQRASLIPSGFRLKLFIVGAAYTVGMGALSGYRNDDSLLDLWFRTAIPISWAGACALHWLFSPSPRPTPTGVLRAWRRIAVKQPGVTIWWTGMAVLVTGFVLVNGPALGEQNLQVYEIAVGFLIALSLSVGLLFKLLRRV